MNSLEIFVPVLWFLLDPGIVFAACENCHPDSPGDDCMHSTPNDNTCFSFVNGECPQGTSICSDPIPQPTFEPVPMPTLQPTLEPTSEPTSEQTLDPPTSEPTSEQTLDPTSEPTSEPSSEPTSEPSSEPTSTPTSEPTSPTSEQIEEDSPSYGDVDGIVFVSCSLSNNTISLEFNGETVDDSMNCDDVTNSNEADTWSTCSLAADPSIEGGRVVVSANTYSGGMSHCFDTDSNDVDIISNIIDIQTDGVDDGVEYQFLITYVPEHDCENDIEIEPALDCRWFDPDTGAWKNDGCELTETGIEIEDSDELAAKCRCTHLTAFAIVQSISTVQDLCNSSKIAGNPVWIVAIVWYAIFLFLTFHRLRVLYLDRHQVDSDDLSRKNHVHIMLIFLGVLNIAVAVYLYSSKPSAGSSFFGVVATMWAIVFVLRYWMYALVMGIFFRLVVGEQHGKLVSLLKSVLWFIGVLVSLAIATMLIGLTMSGIRPALEDAFADIALTGSILVGVLCICISVGLLTMGVLLLHKLREAAAIIGDENYRTQFKTIQKNILAGVISTTILFFGQSVLLVLSGANPQLFFDNFVVCQFLYVVFDVALLCVILFLFFVPGEEEGGAAKTAGELTEMEHGEEVNYA